MGGYGSSRHRLSVRFLLLPNPPKLLLHIRFFRSALSTQQPYLMLHPMLSPTQCFAGLDCESQA